MTDSLKKLFILVVEDDVLQRMAASDMFQAAGYLVHEASSVEDALLLLLAHPDIALVFTDLNLSGVVSGLSLALDMAEHLPQTALIMVSGQTCPENLPSGARFHPKPYDPIAVLQQASVMTAARYS